jgi:hypothetical protein
VTGIRIRLSVGSAATAGTVWFDDISVNKTQTVFQRLIAGTNPGDTLTNDVQNLFTGIVSNAGAILNRALQGDLTALQQALDPAGTIPAITARINNFLHPGSSLNADRINSGNVADQFVSGVRTMLDNAVTGLQGIGGAGFSHNDAAIAFQANKHALVDHGAGIIDMYARMTNLESQFAALPVAAGGTGSGNAAGGLVGAIDTDLFERVSSSGLGPLWITSYVGSGLVATPNGHDATFAGSGVGDCDFLFIRNNPDVPRSQTDYQRVTKELSSKAERLYDALLGTYNYAGANDVWLRISDASTSLANITGIRIRWEGDGGLSIMRFISGAGVLLAGLGTGGIVPPGPGAQLTGEAGVLKDGAPRYFRAKIGESIRLGIQEVGTASGLGAGFRRWGWGGRAEGHVLPVPGQSLPGGVHFWNGLDQTNP